MTGSIKLREYQTMADGSSVSELNILGNLTVQADVLHMNVSG